MLGLLNLYSKFFSLFALAYRFAILLVLFIQASGLMLPLLHQQYLHQQLLHQQLLHQHQTIVSTLKTESDLIMVVDPKFQEAVNGWEIRVQIKGVHMMV